MSVMMPVLPYDVWFLVYGFLPDDYRRTLYSVNSALFHLAMDERYANLDALQPNDDNVAQCLSNLSPMVVGRVKSLALQPQLFHDCVKDVEEGSCGTLHSPCLKPNTPPTKGEVLLNHIPKMTALAHLKLACSSTEDVHLLKKSARLLKSGWIGVSWLSKLELRAPLEIFHEMVTSSPIFHQLDSLTLMVTRGNLHMVRQAPLIRSHSAEVADFVNNKCCNVAFLSVTFQCCAMALDLFFASVQHMPRLSNLFVDVPTFIYVLDDLNGFYAFLKKHATQLDVLTWGFDGTPELYGEPRINVLTHPIFSIALPRVTTLTFLAVYSRMSWMFHEFLRSYLKPFRPRLTHLYIHDHIFELEQLMSTLEPLMGEEGSSLQVLKVEMWYLNCALFDYLSTSFTQLKELDVSYTSPREDDNLKLPGFFVPQDHDWKEYGRLVDSEAKELAKKMDTRTLTSWDLRKLNVEYRGFHPLLFSFVDSQYYGIFKQSIVNALPSVTTFNGQTRATFVGGSV